MSTAVTVVVWFVAAIALLLIGLFVLFFATVQIDRRKVQRASSQLFTSLSRRPKFQAGGAYGWPTFVVSFESKDDFLHAKRVGDNDALLQAVQELFAHKTQTQGTRAKPRIVKFVAEVAVTFRYPGFEAERAAEFREQARIEKEKREAAKAARTSTSQTNQVNEE